MKFLSLSESFGVFRNLSESFRVPMIFTKSITRYLGDGNIKFQQDPRSTEPINTFYSGLLTDHVTSSNDFPQNFANKTYLQQLEVDENGELRSQPKRQIQQQSASNFCKKLPCKIARKKRSDETSKTLFFQPDRPSYAVPLADDMDEI
ncbi:hypothetical protein PV325_008420 [Microctonus aethiopoides]|nr:hypothetical protein PV325_008420 [Microctonus aethiopoides]